VRKNPAFVRQNPVIQSFTNTFQYETERNTLPTIKQEEENVNIGMAGKFK
jgi:hypothetical protein